MMIQLGYTYHWEDLMELSKKEVEEVLAWFVAHGEDEDVLDLDLDEDGDGQLDVGGYWSDSHPVIEFEDGRVVRWYRSDDWD